MKFLDAHQHFWDLDTNYYPWLCDHPPLPFRYGDYASIRRNYLPGDYAQDTAGLEIIGSVHVEAEWNRNDPVGETRWLSRISRKLPHPVVFVAQAQFDHPDIEEVLKGHSAFAQVRGIRHKPKSTEEGSAADKRGARGSMDDPQWRKGYALLQRYGYSFDLQIPYWHLDQAADLAADFPKIMIIINHTGLPAIRNRSNIARWYDALARVAERPNIAIKISGLGLAHQNWSVDANREIVLKTIDLFGTDRCMFASNFPVDGLCADLGSIIQGFRKIVDHLSDAQRAALFHGNAAQIYRFNS